MPEPHAARYTHGHHEAVLRSHRWRTVENSAAYLRPHLGPGTSILDVGCGPGTITLDFADLVAPADVIGIDIAPAAIEAADSERQNRGATNVEFRVADLYAFEFDDDSFDVVHAHQVLQHLVDPVRALREMRRVCTPGGLVAARDSDYRAFTWYPTEPALDAWLTMYDTVARTNHGEPDAGRHLLAWAHAAGFADVTAGASTWCFATPEDRRWWGELWADRITESAIATQAVDIGAASRAELREMADAWRGWAAHPDGWFAVLHGEILARA
jgi:SAM-dependent methyltransferase